ncbi:unnamed protein product [Heterosigma akashiwo]
MAVSNDKQEGNELEFIASSEIKELCMDLKPYLLFLCIIAHNWGATELSTGNHDSLLSKVECFADIFDKDLRHGEGLSGLHAILDFLGVPIECELYMNRLKYLLACYSEGKSSDSAQILCDIFHLKGGDKVSGSGNSGSSSSTAGDLYLF